VGGLDGEVVIFSNKLEGTLFSIAFFNSKK
jgi:hypothetical protein